MVRKLGKDDALQAGLGVLFGHGDALSMAWSNSNADCDTCRIRQRLGVDGFASKGVQRQSDARRKAHCADTFFIPSICSGPLPNSDAFYHSITSALSVSSYAWVECFFHVLSFTQDECNGGKSKNFA